MKLLVALGNPGKEYEQTRHNIGFDFIDLYHDRHSFPDWSECDKGLISSKHVDGEKIILLKPQTFMNSSGECVVLVKNYFKIENEDIYVFHDDLDLPFRKLKFKNGGGHGGHNGLRSVDKHIGQDYFRVRMGIGKPESKEKVIPFVLGKFDNWDEVEELNEYLFENMALVLQNKFDDIMTNNKLSQ